jgi:hypothetical protein
VQPRKIAGEPAMNYDEELKWCPQCKRYVKYLQSYDYSYCADCGEKVHLFSKDDWQTFQKRLKRQDHRSK